MKKGVLLIIIYSLLHSGVLISKQVISRADSSYKNSISNNTPQILYLIKCTGNLSLAGTPDVLTSYMHIPISYKEQVPVYIKVECNRLKSYRFVKYDGTGVLLAANLIKGTDTYLKWTAYVMVKKNDYTDLPSDIPMTQLNNLPDSVKQWLNPSDCCQSDNDFVISEAKAVSNGETNLIKIVQNVLARLQLVPWGFGRNPMAFDAYYALNWGNTCTGHAHGAIALLRALGIPARSILNIPHGFSPTTWMDHHWIADFYAPGYGWVNIEPSMGVFKYPLSSTVITYISNHSDEFPYSYITGCDDKWIYSEPGIGAPNWGRAHQSELLKISYSYDGNVIPEILALTRKVFTLYTDLWGISLSEEKKQYVLSAYSYQISAFEKILAFDESGFLNDMNMALTKLESVKLNIIKSVYFNDFETDNDGWTHYGAKDQWEKGTPVKNPYKGYSGNNCWGTKLSGMYDINSDAYLESPLINLNNLSCAYLSFWTWNSVAENFPYYKYAGFHTEISTDGSVYKNILATLGGINDDQAIPQKGGWTKIIVDLTDYVGKNVKIRFHFTSITTKVHEGSFIDDFKVYGRELNSVSIAGDDSTPSSFQLYNNYPNPFNPSTRIKFSLPQGGYTRLSVYDLLGREVGLLVDGYLSAGSHEVDFNAGNLASGSYFYRIASNGYTDTKKLLLAK